MKQKKYIFSAALVSLFASMVILSGCVAVGPRHVNLDAGEIPAGHSAVFVAVPIPSPDGRSSTLEMAINRETSFYLHQHSLNLCYIPTGLWSLTLTQLEQDYNNQRIMYNFEEGEIYRFTLVLRLDEEDGHRTYRLVPATQQSYDFLLDEADLPQVTIQAETN